ncbi:MAG: hypothetical protein EXR85_03910 [Xanthomonadales bacterium]|nr:hypothetical protein [Xanthomonadales bacterium]
MRFFATVRFNVVIAFFVCVALTSCAHSVSRSAQASTGCTPSAENNRAVVLAFYKEGLTGLQPRKAFEQYATTDFVEHKADVESGTREATILYLERLIKNVPDPRWEVIRTVSEGDLVFLHARFTPAQGAPAYSVGDVFRLQNCLIVEHWDIVAGPPEQQRNPNSRF